MRTDISNSFSSMSFYLAVSHNQNTFTRKSRTSADRVAYTCLVQTTRRFSSTYINPFPHMCRLLAVCKGAIARRLEQVAGDRIYMRKCPRSYGIIVSQPFSPYLHAGQTFYDDPFDGDRKVREQVSWLVKKGDLILSNEAKHAQIEFCRRFGHQDPRVFINRFVSYTGDDTPQSLEELSSGEHFTLLLLRTTFQARD
jgi:hypothetical protein